MKTLAHLLPFMRKAMASRVTFLLSAAACHATTFLSDGYAVRVWQTNDGLPNLRQRLASIDGECEISSEPSRGTIASFHVNVLSQSEKHASRQGLSTHIPSRPSTIHRI